MGGSPMAMDDDWELPATEARTIVLLGRTGNGKSATGNSILGRKAFKSRISSNGVTSTCELQTTVLKDGQVLNVIDTPGLFEISPGSENAGKEIIKCIDLAKNGIHAVLVVFSIRNRFSKEEEAAIQSLVTFFGEKIIDYMIVVFTSGDALEDDDDTLEDYLGRECPKPLKEVIKLCKNRMVLFDNKTKDEKLRGKQVQQLNSLVSMVIHENGGKPYSDELFDEIKKGATKLHDQEQVESLEDCTEKEHSRIEEMYRLSEEQLTRITEMVDLKLRETTQRLEQQLAKEHAARMEAEELAAKAQMKSSREIRELRQSLERAQKETEELRLKAANGRCAIL